MATTVLAVCNRALGKIGAPRINTLSEDTPSATAVGACFPAVPDWVLRAHRWRFALKRAVLAEADAVPAFGYGWSFTLPADCLATAPEADTADWTVEGRNLLTNETPPLRLRYIAQMPDASLWDPAFAEVLACRIALEVQPELAPLRSEASLQAAHKEAVSLAIRSGAIELPVPRARTAQTSPALDDPWLTARL
jgi:hypothetical protein